MRESEIAIALVNITKTFKVPHQKNSTILTKAVSVFKKRYDYSIIQALNHVHFSVDSGTCVGITGNNGSGKTTLLKVIAGIIKADSGWIFTSGKICPLLDLTSCFYSELPVKDNIYIYSSILGIKDISWSSVLDFAELLACKDVKFRNLSAGMQLRLGFSVAIHSDADVFLIDEVLAVGDSDFQSRCLEVMQEFKRRGKTIVLASHSKELLDSFCDRVVRMDNGRIIDRVEVTT